MKWLLWREYHLNRLILVSGAVILLLPYLVVLGIGLWTVVYDRLTDGPSLWFRPHRHLPPLLLGAVGYSLALSQLTIALLAGNAMAGERADRSAEFMAYLPVSRPKRMAAKLILAGCAAAVIWSFSSIMASLILEELWTELGTRPWDRRASEAAVFFATYVAITGATFFGVAWLVSSFQSSPTFAACAGLITPVLVVAGLQAVALLCKPRLTGPIVGGGYAIICLSLACCGLAAGSLYYIRRVEP
jgi:hypothetical protein